MLLNILNLKVCTRTGRPAWVTGKGSEDDMAARYESDGLYRAQSPPSDPSGTAWGFHASMRNPQIRSLLNHLPVLFGTPLAKPSSPLDNGEDGQVMSEPGTSSQDECILISEILNPGGDSSQTKHL